MSIGGKGVISVAPNLLPREIKALVEQALAGDFGGAAKVHHRLFPLIKSLYLDGNPAGIKYAMSLVGKDSCEMRLPLWEANEPTKTAIRQAMERIGVR